jgi:hypothetical protein
MDDLKKLTVGYLRSLARKRIGRGHSKLKTKAQLLNALKDWLLDSLEKRLQPVKSAARSSKPAAKVGTPAGAKRRASAGERRGSKPARRKSAPVGPHRPQPLIEGFFVARVAGEGEVRRHGLTEASTAPSSGGDGMADLPEQAADLRVHALARDPGTLFAFWDFPKASWQRAARGLRSPRPVLRVFQGDHLVRELEFVPESRSFYVHHLTPGQQYRVEAYLVGIDGRSRQVGHPSAVVELPSSGHTQGEARFAHLAWGSDLRRFDSGRVRIIDERSAQALAESFSPQPSSRPFIGSSERRGWLFSPSGFGRR